MLPPAEPVRPPPATKAARPRLIVLDLANNGVEHELAGTLLDVLSTALTRGPFDVTTAADLRAISNLEADKQALGNCKDSAACIAEIANALGADLLVHGSIGKIGDEILMNVAMFDARKNMAIAREKAQGRDQQKLVHKVEVAATRMIAFYEGKEPPPAPPDEDERGGLGVPLLIGGSVVGVAGVAAAVIGGLSVAGRNGVLERKDSTQAEKDAALKGYAEQSALAFVGVAGAVVGAGIAATSLLLE
ncbi:MAG: hypothetical protein Q8O67_21970 [Deltaproteobacteria bacterium]|nr:hypothetical protein [Deltaproteobacteria bacterium]